MANALQGTWIWIWDHSTLNRSYEAVVALAKAHGVDGLLVRAWNGERATNPAGWNYLNQYVEYEKRCKPAGIAIAPWTYVYGPHQGNDPAKEATTFLDALPNAPFYVIDLEAEYKGAPDAQVKLVSTVASRVGVDKTVVCTFDLPSFHGGNSGIQFQRLAPHVGVWAPMVYWADRGSWNGSPGSLIGRGADAVRISIADHRRAGITAPIRPAFQGHTSVTPAEVRAGAGLVDGISLWRLGRVGEPANVRQDILDLMPSLYPAPAPVPVPVPVPVPGPVPPPAPTPPAGPPPDVLAGAQTVRMSNRYRDEMNAAATALELQAAKLRARAAAEEAEDHRLNVYWSGRA